MPVGEVAPELDGKLAENMDIDTLARGIVFNEIRKSGWKRGDFAKIVSANLVGRGNEASEENQAPKCQ